MATKTPIVLYRDCQEMSDDEKEAIKQNFPYETSRMRVPHDSLIIGRYSTMPFYKELEEDVSVINSTLINSYKQHRYVADIQNYYYDLQDYTPKTYFRLEDIPENGKYVLKGITSSRKNLFNTHMFADGKKEAIKVASRLYDDALISSQGEIVIREFVDLVNYGNDPICGIPIAEEFRFFILDGKILSGGYYWSSHIDKLGHSPSANCVPPSFLNKIINIIKDKIRFVVIDVAQTKSGEWIVIELNDGTMSGLSENDPYELYSNMKKVLTETTNNSPLTSKEDK